MQLSASTSDYVNWSRVNDPIGLVLDELGVNRGGSSSEPNSPIGSSEVGREVVRKAFDQASAEFRRVLEPTSKGMRWAFIIVAGAIAAAVAGAALSFLNPWGGGLLTLTGLGTMLGFLRRAWELSRDQAMLELVPARFELALTLANTPKQFGEVLNAFLKETAMMRHS